MTCRIGTRNKGGYGKARVSYACLAAAWGLAAAFVLFPPRVTAQEEFAHSLAFEPVRLGSWSQRVKAGYDPSNSTALYEGDDAESTVEALTGTCQNFIIAGIDTDSAWADFIALAAAASLTPGMKVYAATGAPHLNNDNNRWFAGGAPAYECGSLGVGQFRWECDRRYMQEWVAAWALAAESVSQVAAIFPDTVAGLVINDFFDYVPSVDLPVALHGKRVLMEEIGVIQAACRSTWPHCGLYPAIVHTHLGRFISPGYTLGANYGVKLRNGERMVVRFDRIEPYASQTTLRFFESREGGSTGVTRSVVLNGATVWSRSLGDASDPPVAHQQVPLTLSAGLNRIELVVAKTGAATNGCANNLWYVWDVSLERIALGSGRVITTTLTSPRYETVTNPTLYTPSVGCLGHWFDAYCNGVCGTPCNSACNAVGASIGNNQCRIAHPGPCGLLPDSVTEGRARRRLIAAPNTPYLIRGVIDGIVPYTGATTSYGSTDALDPDYHYGRLLSATKRDLAGDDLIPMHWSLEDDTMIDVDILERRLRVAAATTNTAGVYNFPLGMYFMDPSDQRGIFAEHISFPLSTSDFMVQWPSRQGVVPGWYARHVYTPPALTTEYIQVTVWDSENTQVCDDDSNCNVLRKTVECGASSYSVDPFTDDDEDAAVVLPSSSTYYICTTAEPLRIGMLHNNGLTYNSVPTNTRTYFNVTGWSAGGTWTYESGVSDPHTQAIYDRVVEVFCGLMP